MADGFQDKVALVTGGASGIGAASARHLASLGAHVVVIDLGEVGARTVADEIGGTAAILDVADAEAWEHLLADVWGYDYYGGTRTVDVHVRRLRAKLGTEHESLIGTVRNVGYRFSPDSGRR